MPQQTSRKARRPRERVMVPGAPVTLKMLSDHLGLSPATISVVVNRSPVARAIPRATQERILEAARRFN